MSDQARQRQLRGDPIEAVDGELVVPRKHARKEIASRPPTQSWSLSEGRKLSRHERRELRERRQVATAPKAPPEPPPTVDLPDDDAQDESRAASRGIVAVGALLIAGLVVIAFGGSRLFGPAAGDTDDPPTRQANAIATPFDQPLIDPPAADATPGLGLAPGPPPGTPVAADVASTGRRPVVCIDPGHGGALDRGRVAPESSAFAGAEEALIVLEHAWDLEARLEQQGVDVVLTRNDDLAVNSSGADVNGDGRTAADDSGTRSYSQVDELQARINICNRANADLLLSLHVNGFDRPLTRGFETWFTKERVFGDQSWRFATLVYRGLEEELAEIGYVLPEDEARGVKPDTILDDQRERASFRHLVMTGPAVEGRIDPSRMPGALVEALFITNEGDAAILTSPEGRDAIVTAYERAILTYFEEYPPQ